MKRTILLTAIILGTFTSASANGRIGDCYYGLDSSGQLFLSGGEHIDSDSQLFTNGDKYRCSDNDALVLLKINNPFAGEMAAFIHLEEKNNKIRKNVREIYGCENGKWSYALGAAPFFSLMLQ